MNSNNKHDAKENCSREKAGKRKLAIITASAVAALAVLTVVAAVVIMASVSTPVTGEIGGTVDLSAYESGLAHAVCSVDADNDLSTDSLGERELSLTFFGFIHRKVSLTIVDTTAPEFEVQNVSVAAGMPVSPEDFVVGVTDMTSVTFRFESALPESTDEKGVDVTIIAVDEGANETKRTAHFVADTASATVEIEFGCTVADILKTLEKDHPQYANADLTEVDASKCGDYIAVAEDSGAKYRIRILIRDTIAPAAEANSFDLRLGDKVTNDELLGEITDASKVSVNVSSSADFGKPGTYDIPIILTDESGNSTSLVSEICIHDIPAEVSIERGVSTKELTSLLLNGDDELTAPALNADTLELGTTKVTLVGKHSEITTAVTVKDTVAPVLSLKDFKAIAPRAVSPVDFVASCKDASRVSYAFDGKVSTAQGGTFKVTVIATDEAGNRTSASANLTVIVDNAPPVFYGVKDLSVELGAQVSYLNSVYAVDEIDGNVRVDVDASAVNTAVAGSYKVHYTASDLTGNVARADATVTVNPRSLDSIYAIADGILAQITTPSAAPRDKAWAIYQWCTSNIRYSTSTSYLMGNFIEAAYSGFRTRAGNCYVYYAVSSVLLTRAGITNIEIRRNSVSDPHYWNLVQIGGSWYHFDSCPHYRYAPLTSFLLTDAEVAAYSASSVPGYYNFDRSKYPPTP